MTKKCSMIQFCRKIKNKQKKLPSVKEFVNKKRKQKIKNKETKPRENESNSIKKSEENKNDTKEKNNKIIF